MAHTNNPAADALLDEAIPVLDKGFVAPEYLLAIEDALANGYRVEPETGTIYGLKGAPLTIKLHGAQRYPTIPLVTPNMPRRSYSVPAHKVVAFAVWGRDAFALGVQVRHLDGNPSNCTRANLALGTSSQNQLDKSAYARSRAARLARAAQPTAAVNRRLSPGQARDIHHRYWAAKEGRGKVPNGMLRELIEDFGITKSAIHAIVKGKSYVS